MRCAKLLIVAFLCLNITALAQSSILKTMVSGSYSKTPVSFVLKDIEKRYKINFYYSNNLKSLSKEVSLTFQDKPLKNILDEVFLKTGISYQVVGTQIILKKIIPTPPVKKVVNPPQSLESETIINASIATKNHDAEVDSLFEIYQSTADTSIRKQVKNTKDSATYNQQIKYQKITSVDRQELDRQYREARRNLKQQYISLTDSLNKNSEQKGARIKDNLTKILYELEKEIEKISDSISNNKIVTELQTVKNKFTDTTVNEEGLLYRPAQFSILPSISSNGPQYRNSVNNISINLLGGYAAGLEGAEVGSIFNIEGDYIRGSQFAGVFNVVKNDVTGLQAAGVLNIAGASSNAAQLSGVVNIVADSMQGLQAAGFCNIVNGNFRGAQAAGFTNVVNGKLTGPQFAGFLNYAKDTATTGQFAGFANINSKTTKGVQVAGFINYSKGALQGKQTAGFINIASNIRGSQLGIINVADTVQGVQLGLISIAKNGYRKLEVFTSETTQGNMSFKMGNKKFYNIFSSGFHSSSSNNWFWTLGYGFGTEFSLGKKGFLNLDLVCNQVNERKFWNSQYLNLLNQVKLTSGFSLAKHFSIYAGPVFNVMVSQKQSLTGEVSTSSIAPSWRFTNISHNKTNVQLWVGFNIGIRI